MRYYDAHIHADNRSFEELQTMALFGTEKAITCAVGAGYTSVPALRDHFRHLARREPARAARASLPLKAALGLHPMGAGQLDLAAFLGMLREAFAQEANAVALGEVGLERSTPQEHELLLSQLKLAQELRLPAIIHCPEANKLPVTQEVLRIVKESGLPPDLALIDHVNGETLELVRGVGAWAGLTVHPRSLTPAGAAALLAQFGGRRAILSSDVGSDPADLWALPKTALEARRLGVKEADLEAACYGNAASFFQQSPKA